MRVFIYGAGRVGISLALAWRRAPDLHVLGAWSRSWRGALAASQALPDLPVSSGDILPEQLPQADVILLSVVDDAVSTTAQRLAPHLRPDQLLLHTSGALPASALHAPDMRAACGGLHPLQSLASPSGDPHLLRGAFFAIEGHPDALHAAHTLAVAAGGEPVTLRSGRDKVLYHAAAVVAANYLTVLVDAAATLHAPLGIDARTSARMLSPLLHGTLAQLDASIQQADPDDGRAAIARSLTGPARRGDQGTLDAHIKALERLARQNPDAADLPDLYRALLRRALEMARRATPPGA